MTAVTRVQPEVEVSVIISTHDRPESLAGALPRVVHSARSAHRDVEVIVVDNAPSTNETRDLVLAAGCIYVCEPQQGLGRARNAGVEAACGSVLLFVDDDVEVPENWVEEMSAPVRSGACDIVAGEILPGDGREPAWMGPILGSTLLLPAPPHNSPSHLIGASFGCSREVFRHVRFDPDLGAGSRYGSAEDVLFYEQAKVAGLVVHGSRSAPVRHNFDLARLERGALERGAAAIGRSQAYVMHHWHHSSVRALRLRYLIDRARLAALLVWRTEKLGMSDSEFVRRIALSCKRQLLAERRGPHNYPPRGAVLSRTSTPTSSAGDADCSVV